MAIFKVGYSEQHNSEPPLDYIDAIARDLTQKLAEYDAETARRLILWRDHKLDVFELYCSDKWHEVSSLALKLRRAMELRSSGELRDHFQDLINESRAFEAGKASDQQFEIIAKVGRSEQHNNWGIFVYGPKKKERTPDGRLRAELRLMLRRPWFVWKR